MPLEVPYTPNLTATSPLVPLGGHRGGLLDASGTISSGGVSQSILPADGNRKFLYIQNISDTAMNINFGAAASATTILLAASGGSWSSEYNWIPTDSVNIFCASGSKAFVCKYATNP